MADNTQLDPGTGGDTIRDKDRAGVKTPIVGLDINPAGSEVLGTGDVTNGLDVDVTRVQGTVTVAGAVTNAGTFAVQDSEKVADNAAFTDGTTKVMPAGYVFDEVAGTALTENDAAAARIDSKRAQVGVIEDATTRGQRAAVSAAGALKVDGSAVTQPVSGTVTASGPLTDAQLRASAVPVDTELPAAAALADAAANPTAPGVGAFALLWNGTTWDRAPGGATNGLTANLKALNGTTIATNSGNKDAGTQRIVIATDQVQLTNALKVDGSAVTQPISGNVTNAGTFAVQDSEKIADDAAFSVASTKLMPVGFLADQTSTDSVNEGDIGAARITLDRIQIVTQAPSADTGGLTTYHLVSAASTNATVVKASAGKLHRWYIYNSNAAARKLAFHNASSAPTAGASIFFTLMIPPTSAANDSDEIGIAFSTGIAITTVTGLADNDSVAVAANDLIINLWYI